LGRGIVGTYGRLSGKGLMPPSGPNCKSRGGQLKEYDENGFLVFRDLFSKEETTALQRHAEMLASPKRGHQDANVANVIEKDGETLRAAWAPEIDSSA
jgi:hypothetical protein